MVLNLEVVVGGWCYEDDNEQTQFTIKGFLMFISFLGILDWLFFSDVNSSQAENSESY